MVSWTRHCPTIDPLNSRTPRRSTIGLPEQHCLPIGLFGTTLSTIGRLDKAQSNHLNVEHSVGQPSDSVTQHWLTIGLLEKPLSNHWTVWHSIIQPLESWTQDCPTIGQLEKPSLTIGLLDTHLTSHWTVEHSINQPLDSWTEHCPNIRQFVKTLSDNCPIIGMMDIALSQHLHK